MPRSLKTVTVRPVSRRRMLMAACAAGGGLNLWSLLAARAAMEAAANQRLESAIRSCVFIFYYGGPSHLDSYDLKPDAPASVRGEFSPVSTSVPGLQICEHLPCMSQIMHKVALVRSMHHTNRLHDSASTELFTGRQGPRGDREEFAPLPQFFPCHGAVLSRFATPQRTAPELPVTHAVLPWLFHNVVDVPCQGGGFLGAAFDPFLIAGNPNQMSYRIEMLERPETLPLQRVSTRRELLKQFEQTSSLSGAPGPTTLGNFYQRAYGLLDSTALRAALDIRHEEAKLREQYGMTAEPAQEGDGAAATAGARPLRGQNLLLARRLVEAGVPFVNVNDFRQQGQNWDSHAANFVQHRRYLLPAADRALAALINDLDDRGLLDSTLVVAAGEFGRTPTINGNAGRDHWPDCYTILLAGGGIQGGAVYGASDRLGAYPDRDPVTPADLAATIYWRFGLHPENLMNDETGRPWRLSDGQPLRSLFGEPVPPA